MMAGRGKAKMKTSEYVVMTVAAPAAHFAAVHRGLAADVPGALYTIDLVAPDEFPLRYAGMAAAIMRALVAAGREPPERLLPVEASLDRFIGGDV
jgi:hypothetical protein